MADGLHEIASGASYRRMTERAGVPAAARPLARRGLRATPIDTI
jgi:hypothetical protein